MLDHLIDVCIVGKWPPRSAMMFNSFQPEEEPSVRGTKEEDVPSMEGREEDRHGTSEKKKRTFLR